MSADGHAPHLEPKERIKSLARALVAIAKERDSAAYLPDAMQAEVLTRIEERAFWTLPDAHLKMLGLVLHEPAVKELCRAAGVLVWAGEETESADRRRVRIVNTEWAATPAQKHAHITATWPMRRACRLCKIDEPHSSIELAPVGKPYDTHTVINSVVMLKPGVVYVHPNVIGPDLTVVEHRCETEWLRWVAVAEKYAQGRKAIEQKGKERAA